MGATNITLVSNPAAGSCSHLGPLYLETTNIIQRDGCIGGHLESVMMGELNNPTVNNKEDESDEEEDDEYQDDDDIEDQSNQTDQQQYQ